MDLNSPRELTGEAKTALAKVSAALQSCQAYRYHPELSFLFALLGESPHLYGLTFQ